MHNTTMATTLQHISDLYLHALMFHRSDQRYCKFPHSHPLTLTSLIGVFRCEY
jgi:hypothetical protein